MTPNKYFFDLLDPLRGFTALTVLVYHVIETTNWASFPDSFGLSWFKTGWMGVDIFFVLSGFVISLSGLQLIESHENYRDALMEYGNRRFRRIAPLYLLTLLVYLLLFSEIFSTPDFLANLGTHLAFIHNWFPQFHRSINAPNWTAAVEVQFYILLILILPAIRPGRLIYFILGAFLLAFLWRAYAFYGVPHDSDNFLDKVFVRATQLPGMIDFFGCGLGLAFFVRSPLFGKIKKSWLFRLGLLLSICLFWQVIYKLILERPEDYWYHAWSVIFPRSLLALHFTLLILLLCTFQLNTLAKKLLMPFIYLGLISYGIYLFHWPILHTVRKLHLPPWGTLAATLGLAIACAALSWHFYERRFLRRLPGKRDR